MRYFLIILIAFIVQSCSVQKKLKIEGVWHEKKIALNKNEPAMVADYEMYLKVTKVKKKYNLVMTYNKESYIDDPIDEMIYQFPVWKFRKVNEDGTYNYYNLTYETNCSCFEGEMTSFTENIHQVQLFKVN